MANYILGDVLNAEAFVKENGNLIHYFSAKTMTESTINVSVTAEEIRGGWGNQLLGKIFHDTNFGVNLTEAMFSMQYLDAQMNGLVKSGDKSTSALHSVADTSAQVSDGGKTLTFAPLSGDTLVPMFAKAGGFCDDANEDIIVWAKDCNDNVASFKVTETPESGNVTATKIGGDTLVNGKVCVTYPASEQAAEQLIVKAAFEPKEFSLYLHGKLFAGDSCGKSKTGRVGSIIIEIPRFQPDGTVDLSFNPSSNVSTSLNGTALAYGCDCGGEKQYATISLTFDKALGDAQNIYSKYTDMVIQDAEDLHVGDVIVIYLVAEKMKPLQYSGTFTAVVKEDKTNALDAKGLIATGMASKVVTVSVDIGKEAPLTKDFTVQA